MLYPDVYICAGFFCLSKKKKKHGSPAVSETKFSMYVTVGNAY